MPLTMNTRPAAYAVVVEQGRILLSHWNGGAHPERAGWTLPGGGMDPGESAEQTVVREVLEETGYHVVPESLLLVDSKHAPEEGRRLPFHALRIVYRAHVVGGALGVTEVDGSTDDCAWVPLEELEQFPTLSLVRTAARHLGLGRASGASR